MQYNPGDAGNNLEGAETDKYGRAILVDQQVLNKHKLVSSLWFIIKIHSFQGI